MKPTKNTLDTKSPGTDTCTMDAHWDGIKLNFLAWKAKCSESMLRKLRSGVRRANPELAKRIQAATNGKLQAKWLTGLEPYPVIKDPK